MRSGHATAEDVKEEEEERDYMLAHGLTDKDAPLDRHPWMEEPRRLPLVVKADMDGSLEALVQARQRPLLPVGAADARSRPSPSPSLLGGGSP